MNTLNFLDANVWLALLWGRHIHSERAREWLERSPEEKFFFCRFTQLTVLRLLTAAGILLTSFPITTADALQARHGCECQKIGIRPHFQTARFNEQRGRGLI